MRVEPLVQPLDVLRPAVRVAPMYRYSRPGRGRYREHWQLSLEAIGSADPAIDAEAIQFYSELLRRLG